MLRLGHILLLVIAFPLVFGQKEAANNAALASNMKQFQESTFKEQKNQLISHFSLRSSTATYESRWKYPQ